MGINKLYVKFIISDVTAAICGVPNQLVKNLHIIWSTLASGFAVDPDKFQALCDETRDIYFDERSGVSWYNISPTLHKVLVHGGDLIRNCVLPIGLTNEEAGEGNNKILRHVRLFHSRKNSWLDGMADLYHRLMDISDPVILEITKKKTNCHTNKRKNLSKEIISLLQSPELSVGETEEDLDEESS